MRGLLTRVVNHSWYYGPSIIIDNALIGVKKRVEMLLRVKEYKEIGH